VARIERGEDVQGGLGQPVTYDVKRMLRDASWTTSDMRHAELLNVVAEAIGGEPVFSTMLEAGMRAQRRAEKAVLRRMARRRGERLGRQARP
jgi:aminoglycoside/choline kinase family phosphotransferase